MSTAFRLLLTLGLVGAAVTILLGPRWRGSFYRSWLRPRLVAFAVLLVLFSTGLYVVRVVNAVHGR